MTMSLGEILITCKDWIEFCEKKGFEPYAVNHGGGDIEVDLTIQEARDFGIVTLEDYSLGR